MNDTKTLKGKRRPEQKKDLDQESEPIPKKRPGQKDGPGQEERPDQKRRSAKEKRSEQRKRVEQEEGSGQEKRLDQKEIHLIVLWISLKVLTECYYSYARGAEYQSNPDDNLKRFKDELISQIHIDHENVISKYLAFNSVKDCEFLDPDYLETIESDT